MKIVDASVLLYATNASSVQHGPSYRWLVAALNGTESIGSPWVGPTARHAVVMRGLLEQAGSAGNLTTDAHLAALAVEHGAEIVTFDRDFARFSVRVHVPNQA